MIVRYKVSVADFTTEVQGDFVCDRCGHRDEYSFTVQTQGSATVGATSADSREVAVSRAEKGAARLSKNAITLLACPRCKEMKEGALGRYVLHQAPPVAVFAAGSALVAALIAMGRHADPVLWAAPTFVVMAVLLFIPGHRNARATRVKFSSAG